VLSGPPDPDIRRNDHRGIGLVLDPHVPHRWTIAIVSDEEGKEDTGDDERQSQAYRQSQKRDSPGWQTASWPALVGPASLVRIHGCQLVLRGFSYIELQPAQLNHPVVTEPKYC
jgi:hypothetical protein